MPRKLLCTCGRCDRCRKRAHYHAEKIARERRRAARDAARKRVAA
jgi:hypothetical protein